MLHLVLSYLGDTITTAETECYLHLILICISYYHNVVCDRITNIFHPVYTSVFTDVHLWLDHWNGCQYQVWTEILWVISIVTNETARFIGYRLYLHAFHTFAGVVWVCVCRGDTNLHALLKSAWEPKTSTKSMKQCGHTLHSSECSWMWGNV